MKHQKTRHPRRPARKSAGENRELARQLEAFEAFLATRPSTNTHPAPSMASLELGQ